MKHFLLILFVGCSHLAFLQNGNDLQGFSAFKKYDDSFITPSLRGKHSISLGGLIGVYGSQTGAFIGADDSPNGNGSASNGVTPSLGFHLGYNYLVLEQRRIKRSKKLKFRDEFALALGGHVSIFTNNEWMVMGNVYRHFFGFKSRFFSWSFFSEYGIGLHKTASFLALDKPLKIDLSLELFRMRFVKQPLYLHAQFNYATSNDFLAKDRVNVGFYGGLRYYFYKRKVGS